MDAEFPRTSVDRYLRDWLAPVLFALLVSATIRFHSLDVMRTMPRMVGNLMALSAVLLLVLLGVGRSLVVRREVVALLLALAVASVLSVLASGNPDVSLLRLELYLAMILLAVAAYLAYRDTHEIPLMAYCLAVAMVHLPFLFSAILWIKDLDPPFWKDGFRLAHFANVRQFAEFGFFAAVCATGLGLLSRRLILPSFLLAAAAVFGLIASGSRGATISWSIFVLLACLFSTSRLRAAIHGTLVLVLAGGLVWYLDRSTLLPSPNIFARVAGAGEVGRGAGFDNARIDLWLMSLKQIAAHPWFGSGPEGYWLSGCCNRRILQAHNFVLQFLLEFGAVGCSIALLLAVRTVKGLGGLAALAKLVLATASNRVLACVLAAFLGYSLIDQTMYHLLPLLHFALFSGLFAAGLAQAKSVTSTESRLPPAERSPTLEAVVRDATTL